jgi:hypothetical protein
VAHPQKRHVLATAAEDSANIQSPSSMLDLGCGYAALRVSWFTF